MLTSPLDLLTSFFEFIIFDTTISDLFFVEINFITLRSYYVYFTAFLTRFVQLWIAIVTVCNEVVKVMFLQASVCPQGGRGCLPQCMVGYHTPPPEQTPLWEQTPPEQTPPRADPPGADTPPRADTPREQTPPGADTPPQSRHPLGADTPREQTPPGSRHPRADTPTPPRYSHCCGLYASYWNAFLFKNFFCLIFVFNHLQIYFFLV